MPSEKPVVLIADDDPVNLDVLVHTLEQDYFLVIAKNGKRALELAHSHHPDHHAETRPEYPWGYRIPPSRFHALRPYQDSRGRTAL